MYQIEKLPKDFQIIYFYITLFLNQNLQVEAFSE